MELDDLPGGWELKPLSDPTVATLNPKKSEVSGLSAQLEVTFVPMAAVDDGSAQLRDPKFADSVKSKRATLISKRVT